MENEEDSLAAEIIVALERTAARVVDLERRLATLETDMRELEFGVRNSLDEIRKGMSGMIAFMEQFQKPKQPPITGVMN